MGKYVNTGHFKQGIASIPNVEAKGVVRRVNAIIDTFERSVYFKIFGEPMTKEMFSEQPPEWADKIATDFSDVVAIAIYAYWFDDMEHQVTGVGVVETGTRVAKKVSNINEFRRTWNLFVEQATERLNHYDLSSVPEGIKVFPTLKKMRTIIL